jgi:hypothetical protein
MLEITVDTVRVAVMSVSGNEEMDMISWGKDLRPYHQFRHNLHVGDGVVCYKDRLVIPMAQTLSEPEVGA